MTKPTEGPWTIHDIREMDEDELEASFGEPECEVVPARYKAAYETLRDAVEVLADHDNWHGNPESLESYLYGHDTPFEIAREALTHARKQAEGTDG